ncbi:MAG: tetratricopeptide repeat protein [Gammaproteobacteria bacterium]|nr:tetratricopeptide repeat protein [Gammaproteobacteria bacterium]
MSLINQMLRDLEQRRTSEVTSSPLNGLDASGSITSPVEFSINYMALLIMIAVIFVSGVLVAYSLGSQQQKVITENRIAIAPEKETPGSVTNIVPENTKEKILSTAVISDFSLADKIKTVETIIKKPVVEKVTPVDITLKSKNIIEATPVNRDQNINKTIRPLTDEQQSQLAFQRAIQMLSRNNPQDAQLALEEALSFSPVHLRARETLAAILLNSDRISEAANSLREGLYLIPDAAPLAKLYARILVDQSDIVNAVAVLERARPTVAADPEYYALLAALYQQLEKYAQAAQVYQQILLRHPGTAHWWMGLALAQEAMGETTRALDAFQRAQRAGGLSAAVLKYIQTRIVALTPVHTNANHALNEFEE